LEVAVKNAIWAVRAGLDDLAEAIELRDWDEVVVRMHGVCTRFETVELIEALTPVAPASIARAWVGAENPIAAVQNIPEAVAATLAADGCRNELVVVFSGPAMTATYEGSGRDEDTAKRLKRTYKRLCSSGDQRPLREPVHDWRARVAQLEASFPNFASVINGALKSHLAIRDLGSRTRLPPMLLLGPPGVGKTHFASELATILQAPMQTVSFASATNGSALSGSSVFWSNSSPGRLAECLAWGPAGQDPAANPLIVLDEIDKAGSDLSYNHSCTLESTQLHYESHMASITKRGDKFLAQVRLKQAGALIFSESKVFETRALATSWGDRLEAKVKAEGPAKHASSKMTVGALVRKHLQTQIDNKPLLGRSTIHTHNKIADEFDNILVREDLKPTHLIAYASKRKKEGVTPATLNAQKCPEMQLIDSNLIDETSNKSTT